MEELDTGVEEETINPIDLAHATRWAFNAIMGFLSGGHDRQASAQGLTRIKDALTQLQPEYLQVESPLDKMAESYLPEALWDEIKYQALVKKTNDQLRKEHRAKALADQKVKESAE